MEGEERTERMRKSALVEPPHLLLVRARTNASRCQLLQAHMNTHRNKVSYTMQLPITIYLRLSLLLSGIVKVKLQVTPALKEFVLYKAVLSLETMCMLITSYFILNCYNL